MRDDFDDHPLRDTSLEMLGRVLIATGLLLAITAVLLIVIW